MEKIVMKKSEKEMVGRFVDMNGEVADKLLAFYEKHKDYDTDITLMIGTDSQNFAYTKIVNVIAIICQGHGGIFFIISVM